MEKTLRKLRKKYTLSTTVLSGIILLILFGAFFGMIVASMSVTAGYTLDRMLENPFSDEAVLDDMGRRCFLFCYEEPIDQFSAPAQYAKQFNMYGAYKEEIARKATEVADGSFSYGSLKFSVRAQSLPNGNTLYAVIDTTSDARTAASVGMLTAVVYLAAVLVSALASYLFSSRALAPVAEAFKKQRDLIANASHELKTPLTVIATNLSVMKSEPDSTVADNAKWIDAMETQIQRMDGLIVNMLQLSKMEHAALPMAEVDFSEVTEGACLLFDAVCFEKGVNFLPRVQGGIRILGDRDSLERLVTGLLDNATKYCGKEGKIGLSLCVAGKRAKLTVINTGEVVSEEDAKHIFDRFYRSDGARANSSGNSFGLGLSIAQATVVAHGGTIKCRGIPDKGTVFEVELPLMRQDRKKKKTSRGTPSAVARTKEPEDDGVQADFLRAATDMPDNTPTLSSAANDAEEKKDDSQPSAPTEE